MRHVFSRVRRMASQRLMGIGIAASSYPKLQPEEAIQHLAEIGWLDLEVDADLHIDTFRRNRAKKKLEDLKSLCQSLGVDLWKLHFGTVKDRSTDDSCLYLKACQLLDIDHLVTHPAGPDQIYGSRRERVNSSIL